MDGPQYGKREKCIFFFFFFESEIMKTLQDMKRHPCVYYKMISVYRKKLSINFLLMLPLNPNENDIWILKDEEWIKISQNNPQQNEIQSD